MFTIYFYIIWISLFFVFIFYNFSNYCSFRHNLIYFLTEISLLYLLWLNLLLFFFTLLFFFFNWLNLKTFLFTFNQTLNHILFTMSNTIGCLIRSFNMWILLGISISSFLMIINFICIFITFGIIIWISFIVIINFIITLVHANEFHVDILNRQIIILHRFYRFFAFTRIFISKIFTMQIIDFLVRSLNEHLPFWGWCHSFLEPFELLFLVFNLCCKVHKQANITLVNLLLACARSCLQFVSIFSNEWKEFSFRNNRFTNFSVMNSNLETFSEHLLDLVMQNVVPFVFLD